MNKVTMTNTEDFKVNDNVVYPAHGVGKIIAEEKQVIAGTEISVYVVSFIKEKMTLRVPVKRAAATGLRHLCSPKDIQKIYQVLQARPKIGRGMWSRRAQEYESKINSGNIIAAAEVVRDLHKNVDDPDRSYSERVIYEAALQRVAGELAVVEALDLKVITERLVEVLRDKQAA
jgi:CarD family transcriptional regulator